METDPQTKRENRIKQNNHSFEGQKSESLTESLYCQQSSHFHNVRLACSRCVRYPIIHCCIIFAILECSESSSCIAFRNIKLQYAVQQFCNQLLWFASRRPFAVPSMLKVAQLPAESPHIMMDKVLSTGLCRKEFFGWLCLAHFSGKFRSNFRDTCRTLPHTLHNITNITVRSRHMNIRLSR